MAIYQKTFTLSFAVHHGEDSKPVRAQWLASAPAAASASLALPCPCPATRPWLDCVASSTSSGAMTPEAAGERLLASASQHGPNPQITLSELTLLGACPC